LKLWNSDPDGYCAKNLIGSDYKPQQKCIEAGQIYKYNERMGMVVTKTEKQLCVELDTGTQSRDYLEYISDFTRVPSRLEYNIGESLYTGQELQDPDYQYYNQHEVYSKMRYYNKDQIETNFPMPQTSLFGSCNNYKTAEFMVD
jgi:hypothetical protein